MEAQIPEWKRGALVAQEAVQEEKKKGMFGKLSSKVKGKISETELAKNFKKSEEYEKLKEMRANYAEFKGNLRTGLEETQNPVL